MSLREHARPLAMCAEPLEGVHHIRGCPEVRLRAGWGAATGRAEEGEEWRGQCQAPSLQGHCGAGRCPGRQSQGKALDTSAPTASYQSHQEHSAVKCWKEQSFAFTEERWGKVSFPQWVWVPAAVRPLSVVGTGQLAHVDSSVPLWKEPVPCRGGQVQHYCWPGAMPHTCFRTRAPTVPKAGKDDPTQRGRPSAGGAGPFSRRKPSLGS